MTIGGSERNRARVIGTLPDGQLIVDETLTASSNLVSLSPFFMAWERGDTERLDTPHAMGLSFEDSEAKIEAMSVFESVGLGHHHHLEFLSEEGP